MSNRVVHFEIHAADPQRAMSFYKEVFGWEFPKWMDDPPYWGVILPLREARKRGSTVG